MKILDACCGSKMFWFDKNNPNVAFIDQRSETINLPDRTVEISPDMIADFRHLPFSSNHFYMVVFDPPHLHKLGKESWMDKKYGVLLPTWELDIKAGFDECMRVLEPYGTLIFKWNENQIKVSEIINAIAQQPLFGHKSGKSANTHWLSFMKIVLNNEA